MLNFTKAHEQHRLSKRLKATAEYEENKQETGAPYTINAEYVGRQMDGRRTGWMENRCLALALYNDRADFMFLVPT